MIIGIIILTTMFIGAAWTYKCEKRSWNNGICEQTGEHWILFDTDSQGGRGYKSGDYTTWISWPRIDKSYNDFDRKMLG